MIIGIGEIPSSILTVIPKKFIIFTIYTNALLYCEILYHGFDVQTELARSMCIKQELNIS